MRRFVVQPSGHNRYWGASVTVEAGTSFHRNGGAPVPVVPARLNDESPHFVLRTDGLIGGSLLHRIALLAIAVPRGVIAFAVLMTVALGIFGIPVAKSLSASGFQDPTSGSARAAQFLTDKFRQGDVQLLIVVSTPDGIDSAPARAAGNDIVDQLRSSPHIAQVTSPGPAPPPAAADLVSRDRTSGLIVAGINGDESQQQKLANELSDQVAGDPRRRHRAVGW